ncbi:hypothetical protein KCP76_16770 [Salmonella enterica subsp. enterica serovar Weltevreden]|nr:hypothetical protein KCP76_16770 [Salmonella enterica subsp. enterica serovar Weltevreden]
MTGCDWQQAKDLQPGEMSADAEDDSTTLMMKMPTEKAPAQARKRR